LGNIFAPKEDKMTFDRRQFGLIALTGAASVIVIGRHFLMDTDSIRNGESGTESFIIDINEAGDWYTDSEGRALLWG
jgi:hypothetical protein